jgi:DNA-directed RNA polymerase specialized sigma24 family protein
MNTPTPIEALLPLQLLDLDVAAAANGDEPPPPPADPVSDREVDAFIASPALRKAMLKVVRGRVRAADAEDVVQVALWAVKRAKRLPTGEKARLQYALAIARNKAITWYRRKEVDRPVEHSFDDARGVTANDGGIQRAIDADHLRKIAATVPPKHRSTFECLGRWLLLGESLADMAREMGVEYDTLRKRVLALHQRVLKTGHAIAGLWVVLFFIVASLRGATPGHDAAKPNPANQPERAHELREHGFEQCMRNDWSSCESDLDAARDLDPDGEDDPKVQAARADVKAAAEHRDDPSWSPQEPRLYGESSR